MAVDKTTSRARARELAEEFLKRGDAKGWFEVFYAEAEGDPARIPWADLAPNPELVTWLDANGAKGAGRRALVVGCGLGDDAELLVERGFEVTAFDISAEAIEWCKRRFPDSKVEYIAADLLELPVEWRGVFHFIFEANTLQVLPTELRSDAISALVNCVTRDGSLLVIARGREPQEDPGFMPWPLTRDDLEQFTKSCMQLVSFDDYFDQQEPPVRRFRVHYHKIM